MTKPTENLIVAIGAGSVLFSLFGVISGGEFLNALFGIMIGVSLIGVVLIERNKKKNKENQ